MSDFETLALPIMLLGLVVAIWQLIVTRKERDKSQIKAIMEKNESELQRRAGSFSAQINTLPFDLSGKLFAKITSTPETNTKKELKYFFEK